MTKKPRQRISGQLQRKRPIERHEHKPHTVQSVEKSTRSCRMYCSAFRASTVSVGHWKYVEEDLGELDDIQFNCAFAKPEFVTEMLKVNSEMEPEQCHRYLPRETLGTQQRLRHERDPQDPERLGLPDAIFRTDFEPICTQVAAFVRGGVRITISVCELLRNKPSAGSAKQFVSLTVSPRL